MQFTPGSRIGKYQILRELGRGGMGVVYLAEDTVLSRSVAVKVLHPQHAVDPGFAQRFQHEARVVGQFFHPNILPVNSFDAVDDVFLLEMPYLERGSLDTLLRSRGVYPGEIVRWSGDVFAALGHCHERGLLHRDVKPTNVLLDEDGRALLSDFGLAKLVDARMSESCSTLTSTGLFVGTVRYAPPEAWDGAEPTPAWDLYSTGVLLYEGLTGKPLYEADTPMAYMKVVSENPVTPPREHQAAVSEETNALVMALLAKQPEARPSSAREALERLQDTPEYRTPFDGGSPTEQLRVTWPTRPSRSGRPLSLGSVRGLTDAKAVRRVFFWLGWAAALGLCATLALGRLFTPPESTPAAAVPNSTTPVRASLLDVPPDVVPTWDLVLPRTRFAARGARVYRAYAASMDAASERHWIWVQPDGAPEATVLAVDALGLAALSCRPQGEAGFAVEGQWGRYADRGAFGVLEGTVRGTARWLDQQRVLLAQLDYRSDSDGLRWQDEITLVSHDQSDVAVLVEAERSDMLMPLLFNELAEREHAWRAVAADWFPALPAARADILPVSTNRSDWVIDGMDQDALWSIETGKTDPSAMGGWPVARKPSLRARWSLEGLLLFFEVHAVPDANPVLDLTLLTRYAVPAKNATRCSLRLQGGRITSAVCSRAGAHSVWEPGWTAAEHQSSERWSAEIFIPFAETAFPSPLSEGAVWRLNAWLSAAADGGEREPVAVWGAPEFKDILNGALLTFRSTHE